MTRHILFSVWESVFAGMPLFPGKLMLLHTPAGEHQPWPKVPWRTETKNDLHILLTSPPWAKDGLNNSYDITVFLYLHTYLSTHIYMDTHCQLIPCWSRAQGERGYHGNPCPAEWVLACFSCEHVEWGSHSPITPPKLIGSITISLQRTDWIIPVSHTLSHFLVPLPFLLCFCWPAEVKGSQCESILPLALCGKEL